MKNRLLLSLAFLFFAFSLSAQDFEVVSVESLPADMSAREEMKTDHNDRQCALLRVATQNIAPNQREGFSFVPDLGSEVVERATRDGEIWLWVSPNLKYLRIKHRDWGQYELRLVDHVTRIEALHTYKVTIKGTLSLAIQEQNNSSPTQQYLVFQLSPTNAMLEVDGQLWEVGPDGTAMKFVNFGTYSYRVQAPNYLPVTGNVIVNDPNNTKTEIVKLISDLVEVTFQVDADAEIWINNEMKGIHKWTGGLGKSIYKIECKQEGHETTMISKEITAELNGQTITLPAPKPIYGSLNVESTPIGAAIYIDGKEVGKTPKCINEILIGRHEIRLTKDGYSDYLDAFNINKSEREQIKASLVERIDMQTDVTIYEQRIPEGAVNGVFSVSETKKVYFSKGNLQYQASTRKWRFAENQWDFISEDNKSISSSNKGWIDLFGWGTGDSPTKTTSNNSSYSKFIDWGTYNVISNGGNQTGQWRTLTKEEWLYVFDKRNTSSGIRYAKAQVNGVFGVILLPDDWNASTYKLNGTNKDKSVFRTNTISASTWNSLFLSAGAVFLPAAGSRNETIVFGIGDGYYWSASPDDNDGAFGLDFRSSFLKVGYYFFRLYGCSVRLVHDCY